MPSLLDLLLPGRCALCARSGPLVCAHCLALLPLLDGPICERCGAPTVRALDACRECRGRRLGYTTARAAVAHAGLGRSLAHRLKGGSLRALANHGAGLIAIVVPPPGADLVTWVPGDRWRTVQRGGHPPELLARSLAQRWRLPAEPLLRSRGHRRPQRGLDPVARRRNVRDAFTARAGVPRRVVLVDDVLTTGATLSACGRALRDAGAERVDGVALARVVDRSYPHQVPQTGEERGPPAV